MSYQKKDGHGHVQPSFFWYDNDKDLKVCFLMAHVILSKLDELGLAKNTIVSFLGDHGFQLGEHGEWKKQTNFEIATRIPMMVHIPDKTDQGITTDRLVEAVDLYPTLVEAAGFPPVPSCPEYGSSNTMLCTEGTSMMPLVAGRQTPWKSAVFSQISRNLPQSNNTLDNHIVDVMGYSIRTDRFR